MIKVQIIKDSVAPSNIRLTTFILTYPRIVHSELMTHRVFSKNSASSRAIPVSKFIEQVEVNPYIPDVFYENQKGMQGGKSLPEEVQIELKKLWIESRDLAVVQAKKMMKYKAAKQHINRILEPYFYMTIVMSATKKANFFALRDHNDADPVIHKLASEAYLQYVKSKPKSLKNGEWHLPFIDFNNPDETLNSSTPIDLQIKCSVARCARTSYLNHDGKKSTLEEDLSLYDRLINRSPIHASPAEHQAMAIGDPNVHSGNFHGWIQYRKCLPNENISKHLDINDNYHLQEEKN